MLIQFNQNAVDLIGTFVFELNILNFANLDQILKLINEIHFIYSET